MKHIYKILISVLLIISLAPFFNVSAEPIDHATTETTETTKDVDTLISELIYYYGEDARIDVLRTLNLIEDKYPEHYEIWNSVIHYWDWIENDMEENLTVAPDGLPEDNTHAFIVLGFALKSDGTMEDELIGRLEVALNSAKKYPNSYVLVTGGVEKNGWTEGDRMRDWLLDNGLPKERIIVENKSSNTVQNASYSFDLLYNDYNIETTSIISSQYHLKRASIFYYTMSLLKAKELEKEPIAFLGEGNVGWYRADKTEESKELKVDGMYSIANVDKSENLRISKPEELLDIMKAFVNQYADEDKIKNDEDVRLLQTHLTSLNHFAKVESYDKAEKHMKNLKQLLAMYQEDGQMDKKAAEKLIQHADVLLKEWQ